MKIKIGNVELQNQVILASGTVGFGLELNAMGVLDNIGAISLKTITLEPREGNPQPRIWKTPSGILNSIGLENPGVDVFLESALPLVKKFPTKLIANIGGKSIEEYVTLTQKIGDKVDLIEVNLSCPNAKGAGLAFGTNPDVVGELVSRVKAAAKVPIIVKLTSNVTDPAAIAKAAENSGADAISAINTVLAMDFDLKTGKPVFANKVAGLSGAAILPIALRVVWQMAKSVKIPIIGMGGITCADDARKFFMAGAKAVSIGTQNFVNPWIGAEIAEELEKDITKNQLRF
ncbi:MAG: dihydroorotate dehydrogenase [Clostridiales bacterium]|jgi:dihydroorotate dehydrogenase (NAD+) catalytic subunit|nr:dihydroorotate dehydrogenase [Clostridiales bacterium]